MKKILTAFCLTIVLTGCSVVAPSQGNPTLSPTTNSEKIKVVASFYPLAFFASQIGGDRVEVVNITPAAAEPHDYEPTSQDIAQIEGSNLLILNGGGLEAWGDDVRKNIDSARTTLVVAGDGLTTQKVTEEGNEIIDPHVWLSPILAKQVVDKIAQGFMEADPAGNPFYQMNANQLKGRLDALDEVYKKGLAQCARRDIVTSHAAFGYLSTAYELKQISITGLSPDAEPSARDLVSITDFVRKNNVTTIFFESLISPKLAETIAKEVGAKIMMLNPIEGMTDTELEHGWTYFTEMEKNLANLKMALDCK